MQAIARARFTRINSRKVGQVLDLIRGKRIDEAGRILQFLPKSAAPVVRKVLDSAVANAGKGAQAKVLRVVSAWVGQGPPLKRMRAYAMGRGVMYKRKVSHITLVVGDT